MMPSLLWCFQNPNRRKRPDLHGDTLRRSSKAGRTIWIPFPSCCTVCLGLESYRPVLNYIQIYFFSSEVFTSNIPWPLSLLEVNETKPSKSHLVCLDFGLSLACCSDCSVPVPESLGRCCSSALQAEAASCQQRTSLFNKSLQEPLLGFAVAL